jgi:hypothetical protein
MSVSLQLICKQLVMAAALASAAQGQKVTLPSTPPTAAPSRQSISAQSSSDNNPFKNFTEFSAIMSGALLGGAGDTKIYRSGSLMRTDMATGYMVTDLNTHATFAYYPDQAMCMEGSIPPARTVPFSGLQDAKVEHTPVGAEVIEDHPCTVENLKFTREDGRAMELKVWEAKDLNGFPIKVERSGMGRPRTVIYRDIQLSSPDPSLFKHPAMECVASPTKTKVQPPAAKNEFASPQK